MGTDTAYVVESLPYNYNFTVHNSMCMVLKKLVDRIEIVFPEIEASRPRCSSGIQSLCLLNETIEKAKQILRYCCESSKLYLVITGDVIVSRCQKSRKNFVQSLCQVQTMVPTMLSAEISRIIDDLNEATFTLDPSDDVAGKAVRELIQQGTSTSDSVSSSEMKALQIAASKLHITSPKAIQVEKRCIKKLLDKVGDQDSKKKKILRYLIYLLKKHGNSIVKEVAENAKAQDEESVGLAESTSPSVAAAPIARHGDSATVVDSTTPSMEADSRVQDAAAQDAAASILSSATLPEEFRCPISMRVMYDPVVIASGQTFERMWIQRWFNDGNDTCPKTKMKLPHCSMIPNTTMKDLISRWCDTYGITISDPSIQEFSSLEISATSIASLGMSMNDLHFPADISNMSLGSLDASYSSDSSRTKVKTQDCHQVQSYECIHETNLEFLNGLSELPWDSQTKMVEDVKNRLQYNNQSFHSLSSENFVEPLIRYLRDACERHDVKAQQSGVQLLLALFNENRDGITELHDDAISILVFLLDSEVVKEALAIFEVLSSHCRSKIAASGALVLLLKVLDSSVKEVQQSAIRILHKLSFSYDICSQIAYLQSIFKFVPFINEPSVARYCIVLLKNLCDIEEARVSVAETNGCITAITQLLEDGSQEEQEHAVAVLLSLCSQRDQYCMLLMHEGLNVIPSLNTISVNGTEKGRASALELLRQLRDIQYDNEHESLGSDTFCYVDFSRQSKEKKSSSKASRFLGLPKPSSLFSKKKR